MFDTQDWTTVADKREDRQEYSDILDEDTGFSEVEPCLRLYRICSKCSTKSRPSKKIRLPTSSLLFDRSRALTCLFSPPTYLPPSLPALIFPLSVHVSVPAAVALSRAHCTYI